jgi:hypothetical protein
MAPETFFPSASAHPFAPSTSFSPLVLADRLLTLAQDADRAGYHDSALRLLSLIDTVLDGGRG